jgi:hypothetical protein
MLDLQRAQRDAKQPSVQIDDDWLTATLARCSDEAAPPVR